MPKIWHVNGLANVENIWAIKENPPYHHSLFKHDVKKFCRGGRTSHISRTKSEPALYYFSDQERFLKIRREKNSDFYQLPSSIVKQNCRSKNNFLDVPAQIPKFPLFSINFTQFPLNYGFKKYIYTYNLKQVWNFVKCWIFSKVFRYFSEFLRFLITLLEFQILLSKPCGW